MLTVHSGNHSLRSKDSDSDLLSPFASLIPKKDLCYVTQCNMSYCSSHLKNLTSAISVVCSLLSLLSKFKEFVAAQCQSESTAGAFGEGVTLKGSDWFLEDLVQ